MAVNLPNKENKARTYAFLDPLSRSTVLLSKTADEPRLQTRHVNNLAWKEPTVQTLKLVTQGNRKFKNLWRTNATTSNRYTLWKTSNCQSWGSTRERLPEAMTTLDMSICQLWIFFKSQYWLDRTTLTLPRQSEWNKNNCQHQAQVPNLIGPFLNLLDDSKHNIQCIKLLCFAAIALNKTMTPTTNFLIGGNQRKYRWNPEANQMTQRFCLPTKSLTQHAWDKQIDDMKRDFSGKTTGVCQTTGRKIWITWAILSID